MKHIVLSSSILAVLLTGLAVAQPASSPPPQSRQLVFEVTVATPTASRVYRVLALEGDCVDVEGRDRDYADEIQVCTDAQPNGVAVRTKWRVRDGSAEHKSTWTAVMARSGARIEGGRTGNVRFALETK